MATSLPPPCPQTFSVFETTGGGPSPLSGDATVITKPKVKCSKNFQVNIMILSCTFCVYLHLHCCLHHGVKHATKH